MQQLVPTARIEVAEHDKRMPVRGALDISRARDEIGFAPETDIEDGLVKYHDFLLDQRRRGVW